jgi:hypothetical protein
MNMVFTQEEIEKAVLQLAQRRGIQVNPIFVTIRRRDGQEAKGLTAHVTTLIPESKEPKQ